MRKSDDSQPIPPSFDRRASNRQVYSLAGRACTSGAAPNNKGGAVSNF
ncbi:MAG TPA: hypothetical protein VKV19_10930 [Ktedonobacteraceae bacterium]|nr:hypothetical protein [Ktedonobacteraceae bacterium]